MLTWFRVLCAAFIGLDVYSPYFFVLGIVSDILDGFVARKLKTVTKFGSILDPFADALLFSMAVITFNFPKWFIALVVFRMLWVAMIRSMSLMRRKVLSARFSGKIKTFFLTVTILAKLFFTLPEWLLVLTAAIIVYSLIDYTWSARGVLHA